MQRVEQEYQLRIVWDRLYEIFTKVALPGCSALVIFLEGEDIIELNTAIGGSDQLREAIKTLHDQKRIVARKMDYPASYPEAWEVHFS